MVAAVRFATVSVCAVCGSCGSVRAVRAVRAVRFVRFARFVRFVRFGSRIRFGSCDSLCDGSVRTVRFVLAGSRGFGSRGSVPTVPVRFAAILSKAGLGANL